MSISLSFEHYPPCPDCAKKEETKDAMMLPLYTADQTRIPASGVQYEILLLKCSNCGKVVTLG